MSFAVVTESLSACMSPLASVYKLQFNNNNKYKLLCPRGTQTCALAVANMKVNGNTARS